MEGRRGKEKEETEEGGARLIRTPGIGPESGMTMQAISGPLAHNK